MWLGCLIRNPKLHHRLEVRLDLLLILPVPQPVVHGLHVAADRGGRHGPVLLRLAISLRKQRTHLLLEAIWESPTEVVRFGGVLRVLMLQV